MNITMFSKFQPPLHPTPQYLNNHHNHHLAVAATTSDDADDIDDSIPTDPTPSPRDKKRKADEDGATIEVVRRPRGRPPGSKNKPKPPIIITREPEPSMSPHILEVAGGVDIVDSLTRYTRRHGVGLCVISASGTISGVTLRQPSTATPGGIYTVHGRYDILSLSAVLLPGGGGQNRNCNDHDQTHHHNHNHSNQRGGTNNRYVHDGVFTISLTSPRGQIVGGKVVGALLAAGTVYVVAASFRSPLNCQKLPVDINEDVLRSGSGGGGRCDGKGNDSSGVSSGGGDGGLTVGGGGDGNSCGSLGMYSTVGSGGGGGGGGGSADVLWAPMAARPAPPPFL